jgi:hypothetical protein
MKKVLLFITLALVMNVSVLAKEQVPLTVSYNEDEQPLGHGYGRTPMRPPLVYIEDYTLTFAVGHPDYTLIIKDEDGYVIYTTTVFSTDTELILPSTLSGDYEVNLVMGNWLFVGYILL